MINRNSRYETWNLLQLDGIFNIIAVMVVVFFALQPLSRFLESFVDWKIINPASNNVAWYRASMQSWMLSWIWPSAWLIMYAVRKDMTRSWVILLLLALLHLGLPRVSLWEPGIYTKEERWIIGLTSWYIALGKYFVLSFMAVVSVRRPKLLPFSIIVSGLWIFV